LKTILYPQNGETKISLVASFRPSFEVKGMVAGGAIVVAGPRGKDKTHSTGERMFLWQEIPRTFRDTMAHHFADPLEQNQSEEAVKSSAFVSRVRQAVEEGQESAAMRMIYSYLYELRMKEALSLCDRILEDLDEGALTPTLFVAVLTITAPLKEKLRRRAPFFRRAKVAISRVRGAEAAERILVGLE
jgi:hypothetical protein